MDGILKPAKILQAASNDFTANIHASNSEPFVAVENIMCMFRLCFAYAIQFTNCVAIAVIHCRSSHMPEQGEQQNKKNTQKL